MANRLRVLLLGAALTLSASLAISTQTLEPDQTAQEVTPDVVATGGYGRFADESFVDSMLISVRTRLADERCAALFGGVANARELLSKTSINYVSPAASNLPNRPAMFPGQVWAAVVGLGTNLLGPGEAAVYARAYPVDHHPEIRGVVFLNDNFLEIAVGRDTAFLHELMHVHGAGSEIDADYDVNYRMISDRCGTAPQVLAARNR